MVVFLGWNSNFEKKVRGAYYYYYYYYYVQALEARSSTMYFQEN